jgi:hypothetical protein
MRKNLLTGLAIIGLSLPALAPTQARADAASDALGQCLITSSSAADRVAIVQWMFSAIASHPDVMRYTNLTTSQKEAISQNAAVVTQRLVTTDCRALAVAALHDKNPDAMRQAFDQLGHFAMRELTTNPLVRAQMSQLEKSLETAAMQDLANQAKKP